MAAQSGQPDAQPGPRPEPDGVPRQGSRERLCEPDFDARSGLVGVSGTIGEGVEPRRQREDRLHSPTGEKGIDNEFYRTLGCWKTYRGPPRLSSGALQFNDAMRDGAWTIVIVVSGKGDDPMNDENVTVGFYMSGDKMVKDGNGDDRARLHVPHQAGRQVRSHLPGTHRRTAGSSPPQPADVMLRDPSYARDLELLRARVDLKMKPDGSLRGYVGGYRPWEPVYKGWVNARGPVIESLTWVRLPAVYYALRRTPTTARRAPRREDAHLLRPARRCAAGVRR